jgi:hypothetical protein
MRHHFAYRHTYDTLCIAEEGQYRRCMQCRKFVPRATEAHRQTMTCRAMGAMITNRELAEDQAAATQAHFTVGGVGIENVGSFCYLGRMLSEDDNDRAAVQRNLRKARARWGRIAKLLKRQGANPVVMGRFYLAVVQAVLLYGSESWVLTEREKASLRTFHHRSARHISRCHIRQGTDGTWIYPASSEVLATAGLLPIDEYIARRKATIKIYVEDRPIFQRCQALQTRTVNRKRWWTDDSILST